MTDTKRQNKVCKYYNTGYCKYKRACKFLHPTQRCEKLCRHQSSPKRHPQQGRNGQKCRRKETCDYKHNSSSTEQDLMAEIEALQITIKHILEENKVTKTKVANVENELRKVKENVIFKDCILKKRKEW